MLLGNNVFGQTHDWYASIIILLDNDMDFVTTPDGLGRDVHKNNIREYLLGNILTEIQKDKSIMMVRNDQIGTIRRIFNDYCLVNFREGELGREFHYNLENV